MKLWALGVNEGYSGGYDSFNGHVIRAETETQARQMANKIAADEGRIWDDPVKTYCEELTVKGDVEIVLSDFLAG